jgi:hypothetical protein
VGIVIESSCGELQRLRDNRSKESRRYIAAGAASSDFGRRGLDISLKATPESTEHTEAKTRSLFPVTSVISVVSHPTRVETHYP